MKKNITEILDSKESLESFVSEVNGMFAYLNKTSPFTSINPIDFLPNTFMYDKLDKFLKRKNGESELDQLSKKCVEKECKDFFGVSVKDYMHLVYKDTDTKKGLNDIPTKLEFGFSGKFDNIVAKSLLILIKVFDELDDDEKTKYPGLLSRKKIKESIEKTKQNIAEKDKDNTIKNKV